MDTGPLNTQVPSYRERKVQLMSLNLSEKIVLIVLPLVLQEAFVFISSQYIFLFKC